MSKRSNGANRHPAVVEARQVTGAPYRIGWYCFLVLVAVTPLAVGALPPQFGVVSLFQAYDPTSLPKAVAVLVLSACALCAFALGVVRGQVTLYWHRALWALVALLAWAGVSTAFSASPELSLFGAYKRNDGLVMLLGYVVVAFLALQYVRTSRDVRSVMRTAVVSGTLVAAYAMIQAWGLDPVGWTGDATRSMSTFGNPDMLGTYLVFPLALATGLALTATEKRHVGAWWAAVALIALAVWATATRGAWLGGLAVAVCMTLLAWGRVRSATRRQRYLIGGAVFALLAAAFAAIVAIRPRAAAADEGLWPLLARLSNGRTVIWMTGLRGWLERPVTGWGPDGFGRAFERAVGADWYAITPSAATADTAHNFLVQALVVLGVPGLVLTVWILVVAGREVLRTLRAEVEGTRLLHAALLSALVGLVVAMSFAVTTPGVSVWLWVTVGLLLAPAAHPAQPAPLAMLLPSAVVCAAVALWSLSWLGADITAGRAMQRDPGVEQVASLARVVQLNPVANYYRQLQAQALVSRGLAEQQAGQRQEVVAATMAEALSAYSAAVSADPGDPLVRVELAELLTEFATAFPGGDYASRALATALQARELAPTDARVLASLANAYRLSGRRAEAEATARLAREIAPEYSRQTLGTLGLETTTTP